MSGSALTFRGTVAAVLVLAVVMAIPPVQSAPVAADLSYTGPISTTGPAAWTAADGALDLTATDAIPPYTLQIAAARAVVTTERWERQDVDVPPVYRLDRSATPEIDEDHVRDVRFAVDQMRPGAHVVLQLEDGGIEATFGTGRLTNAWGTWFSPDPSDVPQTPQGSVSDHMVHKRDQVLLEAHDASFTFQGTVRIGLFEVDIGGDTRDGARTYESGDRMSAPHHVSVGEHAQASSRQLVDMVLHEARVDITWGGAASLVSAAPELAVDGVAQVPQARGDLVYDRLGLFPHDEDVRAEGNLTLHPVVDPAAPIAEYDLDDTVRSYERGSLAMTGRSAVVHIAETQVVSPWEGGPDALVVAGTGAGLLTVALAMWRYGPLAFAALYSRLERGDLLDNAVRAQIYEVVCTNPGISARRVHHLSDASWGTVVHHLAKLEAAGYVVVWNAGRAKCYFENHGKWSGHRSHLALLSRDKTRRIASLVLRVPGIDQNDLIARAGLPQSTVSYHLLKLEKGGLVTKDRMRSSTCYFSTTPLRVLFARLEEAGIFSPPDPSATPQGRPA